MTDTEQIATEILTEMYSEADPPLDFQAVLDGEIDVDDGWYTQHVLDGDRQREILNKHLAEHELTDRQESGITMTCILDYGPTTVEGEDQ